MKKLSLIIVVLSLTLAAAAQDSTSSEPMSRKDRKEARRQKITDLMRQAEEGVLVYSKQSIFGIQLRTNGYGVFYELGQMKTNRKTNLYRIDFTEIKEHKEEKLLGSAFFGNSYIYGKINYFYPVTLGFGQQYMLGQKGNKNGVAVSAVYNGGLSMGLLRPYYVSISDPAGGEQKTIKYSEATKDLFLDPSVITSGGGFGKGWNEITIKPGVFAKAAMRFDYGRFNESVSGLEIGMSLEYYASKVPILLFQKERNMFYQAYVAVLFGRRK